MPHARSAPSGHTYLEFNAPLSAERADTLIAGLRPLGDARVLDLGCGWAELLLRLLAAEPTATGIGLDTDTDAIERGAANAQRRGLSERIELVNADATTWSGDAADVVIAIGSSHAWEGTTGLLEAAASHLRPAGRLLLGEEIWECPPTPAALTALGVEKDEYRELGPLIDLAIENGYRPLSLATATLDEWDAFESGWCAGRGRWLLDHRDAGDADEVRAVVEEHRNRWLHGYRRILGFAYLTLART